MGGDNPSRRAVLGAAVGLSFDTGLRQAQPLLRMSGEGDAVPGPLHPPSPSAAAGPPPRSGEDWHDALAAFEAAAGEVRAFEALCSGRPFEEQEALQDGYDARGEAMDAALRRLLGVPAPDLAALARKIELAFAHEIEPFDTDFHRLGPAQDERAGEEPCVAAILADSHRLAGAAEATVRKGTVG